MLFSRQRCDRREVFRDREAAGPQGCLGGGCGDRGQAASQQARLRDRQPVAVIAASSEPNRRVWRGGKSVDTNHMLAIANGGVAEPRIEPRGIEVAGEVGTPLIDQFENRIDRRA